MDTLGPVSVLDSGRRNHNAVVADRLTRRRSPDRPRLKQSLSELDVVYRIPQPYRTSFSAKHSVERLPGSDRSRSLSPAHSLRSVQSSRSDRAGVVRRHGRAKSPKRVTYDTRVTVRHSDADDSMFTELSSREYESSPSYRKSPASSNHVSKDSGLDYSMQLRDLSSQIIKMDWSKKEGADSTVHSPPGILKESQNSHKLPPSGRRSPNPSQPLTGHRTPPVSRGDKENTPNGSPPPSQPVSGDFYITPKLSGTISRDYQQDRTFSYRQAITDQYSSEVRALVDAGIEEKPAHFGDLADRRENGGLQTQHR
ncbi:uncharacterized protein [Littorina saxatilis]|uniref:uncharacterized protein n=1 Tax=Littorina saxatilis TaxID=31220 RepID=UPI0038B4E0A2